jgi:hypothetical protein
MRGSSACFQDWSDNERFFQMPEDSFPFKLDSLSKEIVFARAIFPPQYSPSSPFSFGTVRLRRMTLPLVKYMELLGEWRTDLPVFSGHVRKMPREPGKNAVCLSGSQGTYQGREQKNTGRL